MSDELLALAREGEKLRKLVSSPLCEEVGETHEQHKENGIRYQNILQESEMAMEKVDHNKFSRPDTDSQAKARFDATAEELERVLVAKEGESFKESGMRSSTSVSSTGTSGSQPGQGGSKRALGKAMTKGGLLFKGKGAGSMARQEDDVRSRMAVASETFRKAVLESQALRQEYFNFQLPKILRVSTVLHRCARTDKKLLKECADELDMGTQYHLSRFAFLYESTLVGDGTTLNPMGAPDEGPSLRGIFEAIDNRTDFKSYMQNYVVARGTPRGPRRDGPYEEGFVGFPTSVLGKLLMIAATLTTSCGEDPDGCFLSDWIRFFSIDSNKWVHSHNSTTVFGWVRRTRHPRGVRCYVWCRSRRTVGERRAGGAKGGGKVRTSHRGFRSVARQSTPIELMEGIDSMGIYRLSGTTSRVQALKAALDRGGPFSIHMNLLADWLDVDAVDIMSEEWSADINVVSGVLKLWFRELPEPLLTYGLYHQFIEAARESLTRPFFRY